MSNDTNQSPCGVGTTNSGIFGLSCSANDAEIILLPVPWDATTSYMAGTHKGPESIYKSSPQLDLYHADFPKLWRSGIFMPEQQQWLLSSNKLTRKKVEDIISQLESGKELTPKLLMAQQEVNEASEKLTAWLKSESLSHLKAGKTVGVVGGDHSTPLGLMQALAEYHGEFGILHLDAHHDYRQSFMGFEQSHASIMHNASKLKEITHFVQVGIRDYCYEEVQFTRSNPERFITFYDQAMKEAKFAGKNWHTQCEEIISKLPKTIYISFDIDGLAPHLCPGTGTPVPSGLAFEEAIYLIKLASKHCNIIGFDLVEVGGEADSIDAIVGARLLWQMCGYTLNSKR